MDSRTSAMQAATMAILSIVAAAMVIKASYSGTQLGRWL
jgi:hypothetical protein